MTFTEIVLMNPNSKLKFGGTFLDIWSGYDIKYVIFHEQSNKGLFQITAMDKYERPFTGQPLNSDKYFQIYWQLIRRGWKKVDLKN